MSARGITGDEMEEACIATDGPILWARRASRTGLRSAGLLCAMLVSVATAHAAAPATQPLQPVPFTEVKFRDEFWAPRLETNRTVTIPHDFDMCEKTGRIANFARAAGREKGDFQGIFYDDSDVYKVIEGEIGRASCRER